MAMNLLRGRSSIDCGCGGKPTPLSWWLVGRNALLTIAAGSLIIAEPVQLTAFGLLMALAASTLLVLYYLTAEQLLSSSIAPERRTSP